MLRKHGVVRTHATRIRTETPPRDPEAMSGLLTGVSFIAGVGGAGALADSPYPRPGSEPAEVRRYFTENSRSARLSATGQLISTASLARFTVSVARLAARSGQGSSRYSGAMVTVRVGSYQMVARGGSLLRRTPHFQAAVLTLSEAVLGTPTVPPHRPGRRRPTHQR